MKRLLQSSPAIDPVVVRSLEIIDRFDELIEQSATLVELAAETAELAGLKVGICDLAGNDIVGQPAAEADHARAVIREVQSHAVRGRRVELIEMCGEPALIASVELAHGRVGVAWLRGTVVDDTAHLVAERLAAAAAVTILRSLAPARSSGTEWTELLTTPLAEAEAERLGAELRLGPDTPRLVILARPRMISSISPAALAQVINRALTAHGATASAMVVRSEAAVVSVDDHRLETWLAAAAAELARAGVGITIGIGAAGRLHQLRDSWLQAMDAMMSCALLQSTVLRSTQAGALSLLRRIPPDLVLADRDVQRIRALSGSDRELLRLFLANGTLRATAAQVFLHHTSVRYRLARISEAMELDLSEPLIRHRLFVACALLATVEHVQQRESD